jgi:hypothetical protein
MHKHNILIVLTVIFATWVMSWPAAAQTLGEQRAKDFNAGMAQRCTSGELHPTVCECQTAKFEGPQFSLFIKGIKAEQDLPKLEEYYIQNIAIPCMLDKKVLQQHCVMKMKAATTEYSDKMLLDYCGCMAEEINENVTAGSLGVKNELEIQKIVAIEEGKAHEACNRVRKEN